LFLAENGEDDRNVMVNTIAPVWDGNETWLVLGGGGLFAVFPLAYAIIMPALYPTIIAMLLALVFRGVAFEFRFRAGTQGGRRLWDFAFCAGSLLAAVCQGLTLGGLLQGIHVENGRYAGGWFDWLDPFTVLCGVAVAVGYALNGATWLVWRTEGRLQGECRRRARYLGVATLACIIAVSVWSPLLDNHFAARWFSWPGIALTSPVPILVALLAWRFFTALTPRHHITPFLCVLGWFVLCFAGLGISVYPHIVPPDITIWDAAAPPGSQAFLLVGAVVLIPMILVYNAIAYTVFRGKVTAAMHYE
ncbi:MAG TPA: cytochrome d ubiquinol oxidase subunit II, partial [Acetobacteraceae bacterium]|nr:cytochrome d ubiquinol oxidase subunit II [Acetobacteraceae bacterium]